jgi:hypothetical protein
VLQFATTPSGVSLQTQLVAAQTIKDTGSFVEMCSKDGLAGDTFFRNGDGDDRWVQRYVRAGIS